MRRLLSSASSSTSVVGTSRTDQKQLESLLRLTVIVLHPLTDLL